jgi:hypothetical protein
VSGNKTECVVVRTGRRMGEAGSAQKEDELDKLLGAYTKKKEIRNKRCHCIHKSETNTLAYP